MSKSGPTFEDCAKEEEAKMCKVFDDATTVISVNADEMVRKLAEKTDFKLRQEAPFAVNGSNANFRNAGLAAQMELERRAQERAELLVAKSTWISAGVGASAAIFGVILGWWLSLPPAP